MHTIYHCPYTRDPRSAWRQGTLVELDNLMVSEIQENDKYKKILNIYVLVATVVKPREIKADQHIYIWLYKLYTNNYIHAYRDI